MTGRTGPIQVRRFRGPRGSTFHLTLAQGNPRWRLPADGALRIRPGPAHEPDARRLSRRLARETLVRHETHRTGFWGAKIVVTGADTVDDDLLRAIAEMLNGHAGTLYAGAGLGVTARHLEVLSEMTPYVLGAAGGGVEPSTATAFGVLGAVEAWARGSVAGLRVLVHGTGKVGSVLAGELAAAGATVLTCDTDPRAAEVPGCRPVADWSGQRVDVLVPCSVSDLIDVRLARRLRCGAVIGAASAVLADEDVTSGVLHRRGIVHLPAPLVNGGAAIVDSIQHYAPEAFRDASPHRVYEFARDTVRSAAAELTASALRAGLSPSEALTRRARPPGDEYCGLGFGRTATCGDTLRSS
ncbi:hypothetical protein [Streptomyces sp. AK02-01A]|uniref:hypothetical protein n=1 Tax=Streptomyces sp. AK02-01A TaxID=3028648 RepID=UPI0029B6F4DA|nr:hypothetical protein [Streptomyces sp. AK02-01A]MDX3852424.1 hypothetical protein [Streptomyces sp. AK02-01A]